MLSSKLIIRERFKELAYLLNTPYLIHRLDISRGINDYVSANFTKFNLPVELINDEKRRYVLKIYTYRNLLAELILERSKQSIIPSDVLKEVDALLFYISIFKYFKSQEIHWPYLWNPYLQVSRVQPLNLLKRAVSKRFFDKIKCLFDVETVEDFFKISMQVQHQNFFATSYTIETDLILNIHQIGKQQ